MVQFLKVPVNGNFKKEFWKLNDSGHEWDLLVFCKQTSLQLATIGTLNFTFSGVWVITH